MTTKSRTEEDLSVTLSISDIVKHYRIGRTTVYEHLKAGTLPAFKVGRGTRCWRHDVEAWLRNMPKYPG